MQRISVKVIPRSSTPGVEQIDDNSYIVRVSAIPEKGKANEAVIKLLSDHLHIPKSAVTIRFGTTSKHKIIDIDK